MYQQQHGSEKRVMNVCNSEIISEATNKQNNKIRGAPKHTKFTAKNISKTRITMNPDLNPREHL